MGEFKEGQYVRVLHTDYHDEFPVGSTFKVGSVYGHGVEPEGEHKALFFLNYELEPWQPRVGEPVRVVGNDQWKGDGVVAELSNCGIFIVSMKTGQFAGKQGGFCINDLEPILSAATPAQLATLKIKEGKFYKTRDGRKVGPMTNDGDLYYPWDGEVDGESRCFTKDGFYWQNEQNNPTDIIAEWIDGHVVASNDNAQPKFKVGDRVCAKHDSALGMISKGDLGTVKSVGGGHLCVAFDNGREDGWQVENFELITPPTTTTIVALIENGQPKPSSAPHVHNSTGAAETEAKRLAAKFKGKQFGVFTLTTTHEEAAPVYDHKWQNLAVLGLKIDAIKELRSITGMGLKPAKDAVEYFLDAA